MSSVTNSGLDYLINQLDGNVRLAKSFATIIDTASEKLNLETKENIADYDDYYDNLIDVAEECDSYYTAFYRVVDFFLDRFAGTSIGLRIDEITREYLLLNFSSK